jgi:[protein-PII] uridylyltransferase
LVRELERLKAGEFKESLPLLTQLARELEKTEILYLGCLFHDIGKGLGGGHSEIGSKMARNIARRMRLTVDDAAQLEFLVRHHLLMTHTAFRRDIEDEKLVRDFALSMENAGNLKMLYLLTYADMRAVGPDVWNNWKGSLLEQLYIQALRVLEGAEKGEVLPEDRRSKLRRVQGRLRRHLLRDYPPEEIARFVKSMPERYFLTTPEEEIPLHFELMERFTPGLSPERPYLSAVRHFPEREYSEMVICAQDRPGLFAQITGVFAALGLDILSARINTSGDGIILDVFRISHAGRPEMVMDPQKWTRVQETLDRVLTGTVDVACLVEKSGRQSLFNKRRAPKVPTVIQIDNTAADDFTIIEVYTQDRVGVLFTITYALHQLGLSIHLAKISTNVDQVADVFYITGEDGRKVLGDALLEKIRSTLYESLITEDAPAFQRLS